MAYTVGLFRILKEEFLTADETGAEILPAGYFTATGPACKSFQWGPGGDYDEESDAFWAAVDWCQAQPAQVPTQGRGFVSVTL